MSTRYLPLCISARLLLFVFFFLISRGQVAASRSQPPGHMQGVEHMDRQNGKSPVTVSLEEASLELLNTMLKEEAAHEEMLKDSFLGTGLHLVDAEFAEL